MPARRPRLRRALTSLGSAIQAWPLPRSRICWSIQHYQVLARSKSSRKCYIAAISMSRRPLLGTRHRTTPASAASPLRRDTRRRRAHARFASSGVFRSQPTRPRDRPGMGMSSPSCRVCRERRRIAPWLQSYYHHTATIAVCGAQPGFDDRLSAKFCLAASAGSSMERSGTPFRCRACGPSCPIIYSEDARTVIKSFIVRIPNRCKIFGVWPAKGKANPPGSEAGYDALVWSSPAWESKRFRWSITARRS